MGETSHGGTKRLVAKEYLKKVELYCSDIHTTMFQLSSDPSVHLEILRVLSHARYFGADINEVLNVASRIDAGNLESFHDEWKQLADRVYAQAEAIDPERHPVSARDAYLRAATYFRAADFYLHGTPEDPRIMSLWEKQTDAFDKALALLPTPGKRLVLKADGSDVPAIFYASSSSSSSTSATPKPTIIIGTGYDGAQEEVLHDSGFAALERGYNVITYEGPGQPSPRRYQKLGFITEWEKVVTPVVDFLLTRTDVVDPARIFLMGISMGGFLAVRAAAFEHRLAAVVANDGVYDVGGAFLNAVPPEMRAAIIESQSSAAGDRDREAADKIVLDALANPHVPISMRWGVEQGMWSFNVRSPSEFLARANRMTLAGLEDKIACPVWVGLAEDDIFFKGQPEKVKAALGDKAALVRLTEADSAGHHCHEGASVLLNQIVFDWLDEVVVSKT